MNLREICALGPVMAELVVGDVEHAVPLARALLAGGVRVLEIALRTPAALGAIHALRIAEPDLIIGAGSLTRAVDFAAAGRVGVHFASSPGLTPELAAAARGARFPLLPGVMTPADLIAARHAGFNVVSFFPAAAAGGLEMLTLLTQTFPDVLFRPSGGIAQEDAPAYLAAGAPCVGAAWLAPPALVECGEWTAIEQLARAAVKLRSLARAENP